MNFKKSLLMLACVGAAVQIFADDSLSLQDPELTRGSKKCGKFGNLVVCNNVLIGGNETVNGTLTVLGATTTGPLTVNGNEVVNGTLVVTSTICAPYIILCPPAAAGTPGVPGIGGALAWGEAGNITLGGAVTVGNDTVVPLTYSDTLSGMTFNGTNAFVLGSTGVYMYMFEVAVDLLVSGTNNVGFDLYDQTTAAAIADSAFGSNLGVSVAALADKVVGFGVASLTTGHSISIRNISGVTVTLGNLPSFGGEAANIAKLRLVRIG